MTIDVSSLDNTMDQVTIPLTLSHRPCHESVILFLSLGPVD